MMQGQCKTWQVACLWLGAMMLTMTTSAWAAETRQLQSASLLLALADTGADNMEGRILAKKDRQPLAGVSVSLVDAEGVVMDVTSTGKDGSFNIELDVLDDSGLEAIRLLYLKIERKDGKSYLMPVKKLIKSFTATVELQDVLLP